MKIVKAEIFDIECPKRPPWHPVLLRLETDEGLTGVGEAAMAYGIGRSAAAHMVKNLVESFAMGADPMSNELLWERMYRESFWGLGGGAVVFAGISAIDMACWDIKGKAAGLPVYKLLGGKTNPTLRSYASQLQFGWGQEKVESMTDPKDYADAALRAVAEGYTCVKVDPLMFDAGGKRHYDLTRMFQPKQIRMYVERLEAIRDAIGSDVDIILEVHGATSVTSALQVARACEHLDIFYYEEPVNYQNSRLHDKVARGTRIPIAGGERIYTRSGLRPYLEDQSLDVIQPDIGLTGGLTEAKKVCDYAHMYDVGVQAHVCGSPISTAAALHLETVIPNFTIHEHHTYAQKSWNIELCDVDLQPERGTFTVPETPGLGIGLNDAVVYKSPNMVMKA
ncbi:mandelate racemase/muconate lactonizing enzyme family protein [Neorhizobium sp. DAR64861/K0K2]|uniref:mandelate racemase/muconate lactonizing enzyme family protein n=1 Tax=unclassified Neorhizobium TaxID=2629175 RepID=UPI003D2925AB